MGRRCSPASKSHRSGRVQACSIIRFNEGGIAINHTRIDWLGSDQATNTARYQEDHRFGDSDLFSKNTQAGTRPPVQQLWQHAIGAPGALPPTRLTWLH
jgi:hypothetical protein